MKKITLLITIMALFAMGSYAQNAWNQNTDSTYLIEGTTGDTVFTVRNGHVNIGGRLVQNPIDWDVDLEINDEDGIAILEMESFSEHTYLSLKAHSDTPWKGGFFSSRRSRGTYAAPLPVQAVDNLGSIDVHGWDGDQPSRGGSITFRVQGTVSDNIVPAQIAFTTVDQAGVWKERMTLMSGGDLSIGTGWTPTAAEVGARFYVKAATADATADAIEAVDASDNSLFVVRNDGNVGIGTTTPSSALHVVGTATATNYLGNGAGLTGITGATGGVANSGSTTIGADTDNDGVGEIALQTQLTTRMTIANGGNVGIGTNTPSTKLDVDGTVTATAFAGDGSGLTGVVSNVWTDGGGNGSVDSIYRIIGSDTLAELKREINGSIYSTNFNIFNNAAGGAAGFNAYAYDGYCSFTSEQYSNTHWHGSYLLARRARGTLSSPLTIAHGDVVQSMDAWGYANDNDFHRGGQITIAADYWPTTPTSFVPMQIRFGTMNNSGTFATRMVIKPDGNVGIGTTGPTTELEVDGDFKASGYFYFGDENTDGNWRASTVAGKLTFEKRESGAWVVKVEMD